MSNLVFNPTGTRIHKGLLKVRFDLYIDKPEYYGIIAAEPIPKELYDENGFLIEDAYDLWYKSVEKVSILNPCLCHSVVVPEDVELSDIRHYLKSILTSDNVATLDGILSAHNTNALSAFMRDKSVLSKQAVTNHDHEVLKALINGKLDRLNIFIDYGNAGAIEPGTITIGPGTADRASGGGSPYTYVSAASAGGAADGAGTIDTYYVWASYNVISGSRLATFYGSGTDYTCRDWEAVGAITAGSEQTFSGLDIDVEEDDLAGIYIPSGAIERDSGDTYCYRLADDQTETGEQTYSGLGGPISIYGTGSGAALQTLEPSGISSVEAFGTLKANLEVSPSGIASVEGLGGPQVNLVLLPSGLASVEGSGTAQLNLEIAAQGVASVEGIGSHAVKFGTQTLQPDGLASVEGLGSPQLNYKLLLSGLSSVEGFGTAKLNLKLVTTGIDSLEGLGSPMLVNLIAPSGVASIEGLGSPQLNLKLSPSGLASIEGVGSLALSLYLAVIGIASVEALGTPKLNRNILADGITSAEALGSPQVNFKLLPAGISSVDGTGTPQLDLVLLPSGLASVEALGEVTLAYSFPQTILPSGIASVEGIGSLVLEMLRLINVTVSLPGRSVTLALPGRSGTLNIPGRSGTVSIPGRDIDVETPDRDTTVITYME